MERDDMVLALLVVVVAIAVLQFVQIFGMYSETGQIKTAIGPQLQSGSGIINIQTAAAQQAGIQQNSPAQQPAAKQSAPKQGVGGC